MYTFYFSNEKMITFSFFINRFSNKFFAKIITFICIYKNKYFTDISEIASTFAVKIYILKTTSSPKNYLAHDDRRFFFWVLGKI